MDALIYSRIYNTIDDDTNVRDMIRGLSGTPTTINEVKRFADEVLDETTIKRACCLTKQQRSTGKLQYIKVKMPIPIDITEGNSNIGKKFKFYEKVVQIPVNLCKPEWDDNFCDQFYQVYCHNVRNMYENDKTVLGEKYDGAEFAEFAPDCACFGKEIKDTLMSQAIPHNCYMYGCNQNQIAYLDKGSRNLDGTAKSCNLTICQSTIDLADISAKDINFVPTITQNCTGALKESQKDVTDPGTTPAEQPTTPTEQPATPGTTPAEQPATPTEQPGTPGTTPATPTEQPSSGLTKTQKILIIAGIILVVILLLVSSLKSVW
jgi:hypothetical protein